MGRHSGQESNAPDHQKEDLENKIQMSSSTSHTSQTSPPVASNFQSQTDKRLLTNRNPKTITMRCPIDSCLKKIIVDRAFITIGKIIVRIYFQLHFLPQQGNSKLKTKKKACHETWLRPSECFSLLAQKVLSFRGPDSHFLMQIPKLQLFQSELSRLQVSWLYCFFLHLHLHRPLGTSFLCVSAVRLTLYE